MFGCGGWRGRGRGGAVPPARAPSRGPAQSICTPPLGGWARTDTSGPPSERRRADRLGRTPARGARGRLAGGAAGAGRTAERRRKRRPKSFFFKKIMYCTYVQMDVFFLFLLFRFNYFPPPCSVAAVGAAGGEAGRCRPRAPRAGVRPSPSARRRSEGGRARTRVARPPSGVVQIDWAGPLLGARAGAWLAGPRGRGAQRNADAKDGQKVFSLKK